jgi:FMN phosphatase YigB (HAD superfamily)
MSTAWLNRNGSALADGVNPDYQLTSLSDLLQITPFKV